MHQRVDNATPIDADVRRLLMWNKSNDFRHIMQTSGLAVTTQGAVAIIKSASAKKRATELYPFPQGIAFREIL